MGNVVLASFGPSGQSAPKADHVAENKRTGFVLMYRSLRNVPFKTMPERFTLWVHLLLEASYDCDEVQFNGNRLKRARGQIVSSVAQLAEACGISEDSARRSLEWFEGEGMIARATRRGARGYTVITITGYDDYQRGIIRVFDETNFADLAANLKPASEQGLQPDGNELAAELPADLGADFHAEALNKLNNKTNTNRDLKSGSEDADATSTPAPEAIHSQEDIPPKEAAFHARSGKTLLWGNADDLTCATWLKDTKAKAFSQRGLAEPKLLTPIQLARWVNEVRLMRTLDTRTHREICELWSFVCGHGRELEFCQSPTKLRDQWDGLMLKKSHASRGGLRQRPLGHLAAAEQAATALIQSGAVSYDDNTIL